MSTTNIAGKKAALQEELYLITRLETLGAELMQLRAVADKYDVSDLFDEAVASALSEAASIPANSKRQDAPPLKSISGQAGRILRISFGGKIPDFPDTLEDALARAYGDAWRDKTISTGGPNRRTYGDDVAEAHSVLRAHCASALRMLDLARKTRSLQGDARRVKSIETLASHVPIRRKAHWEAMLETLQRWGITLPSSDQQKDD